MFQKSYKKRFVQIYKELNQSVRRILYRLQGPENLDDLVQEVFLKIWQGLPRFNDKAQIKTWVYRIATNTAIDVIKKNKLQQAEYFDTTTGNHDQDFSKIEDSQHLETLLKKLSIEQKTLVTLYYFEEQNFETISEILDIPEGTVKSRLYKIRQDLLNAFESQKKNYEKAI